MPQRPSLSTATASAPVRHVPTGRGAVISWLDSRINHERTSAPGSWGLERMRRLLKLLGSPHRGLTVVHVAGTKGKGSTVAMLAAILRSSGHRVGCYMSPHVHGLEERISVDGRPITATDLTVVCKPVRAAVEQMDREAERRGMRGPTWFEILTAMAMLQFQRKKVDLAVLETGLGGRLDATNVCEPILSVITSISLDHMAELGDSIAEIAGEKAGIIKRGCPVVCGSREDDARGVIAAVATRRRAPLLMLDRDFAVQVTGGVSGLASDTGHCVEVMPLLPRRFGLPPQAKGRGRCQVRMLGRHQAENAGLAIAAASHLHARGYPISWTALRRALATVQLPARIERCGEKPMLIVDAAHNAASMESLCLTLPREVGRGGSRILVFAASREKQIENMLAAAGSWADRLILTCYSSNPRAASLEALAAAAKHAVPRLAATRIEMTDPREAIREARKRAGPRGIVCVAGSFFLAGEVRRMLLSGG